MLGFVLLNDLVGEVDVCLSKLLLVPDRLYLPHFVLQLLVVVLCYFDFILPYLLPPLKHFGQVLGRLLQLLLDVVRVRDLYLSFLLLNQLGFFKIVSFNLLEQFAKLKLVHSLHFQFLLEMGVLLLFLV